MSDNQGSISHASAGGVTGEHPSVDPLQLLVGPTTEDQFNTSHIPLIPIACFFIDDVRFAFDSSFVDADCSGGAEPPEDIRVELGALANLVKAHPGSPLSLFGHADPVGTDVYNKSLSERRARAIYGLLIFQSEPDTAVGYWQTISTTENWGSDQRGKMQALTGLAAGTDDSTLFQSYMKQLSQPAPKLSKTDFLAQGTGTDRKGDFQGCSEFNPLLIFSQEKLAGFDQAQQNNDAQGIADRNQQNAVNRRVLGLMFRPGSLIDPTKWPCPRASAGIAGCIKRFWSDGETRRSTHLPNNVDRKFEDKQDTFACRFYQRLAGNSPCNAPKEPSCWADDYEKEISIPSSYGRYCRKYKPGGVEYTISELPVLKFRGKIYAPVKTGSKITVEVRFRVEAQSGASATDVSDAKTKLENGVATYWNGRFTLEADDPKCGKKSFKVEYKISWVASGENYVLKVHTTWPREGEGNGVVNVQKSTSAWTFAHEFGHCVGLPDEYSTLGTADTVKYFKPDGTLDSAVTAPAFKPTTDPSATIMSSFGNTTVLNRHCWNVAIEVQELLTAKLGRAIKCTIS